MNTENIESKFAAMGARLNSARSPSGMASMVRPPTDRRLCRGHPGSVRHRDHATITLPFWHRVIMNTETQGRTMANVAFLD